MAGIFWHSTAKDDWSEAMLTQKNLTSYTEVRVKESRSQMQIRTVTSPHTSWFMPSTIILYVWVCKVQYLLNTVLWGSVLLILLTRSSSQNCKLKKKLTNLYPEADSCRWCYVHPNNWRTCGKVCRRQMVTDSLAQTWNLITHTKATNKVIISVLEQDHQLPAQWLTSIKRIVWTRHCTWKTWSVSDHLPVYAWAHQLK